MSKVTYYVVQPFAVSPRGKFRALDAIEAKDPSTARLRAERLAAKGGAIAFARTGDPDTGDFDDAVVLATFGSTPDLDAMTG
ncbi:MAG: hypothetical protein FD152_2049 [Xanthobacteraceae bacterium]|nr:MAG: hypothetical protein FD152_2049 [Xanthobacteraceae bacterium]